jgi:hypothetical protein
MSYTNHEIVEVRQRDGHKGLFARTAIAKGTLLGCFDGNAHLVDVNAPDEDESRARFWQQSIHLEIIGSAVLCLIPSGELEGVDFLNHACRANAKVVDKLRVYASRDIRAGEEILADYRTFDLIPRGIRCWCDVPDPCIF